VAKTKVLPPPCADQNPNCVAGIRVNFITCASAAGMCDKTCKVCTPGKGASHVCQDKNPKCAAAIKVGFINCATQNGICDKTCKTCHIHRRVQERRASVHRRTQGFKMLTPCKLANFAADMSKLNKACCDEPGMCKTGVPQTCDAKCAITFVEFYNRCHKVLALRVAAKQYRESKQLHDTCSKRLPVEALLRAMATCRHGPSPCAGVSCGAHGKCHAGACQCAVGWSGTHCEIGHCPRGTKSAVGSAYCSSLVGFCCGPGHSGEPGTKYKYPVTRVACQSTCDTIPACVGWSYDTKMYSCGQSRCGGCYLIGGRGLDHGLAGGWKTTTTTYTGTTIDHATGNSRYICMAKAGRN
jgi:hypothetical protein